MTMAHLNSQVQQFGGFTPGKRVFGGNPKMPIGTAGDPHFEDFTNAKEDQATENASFARGNSISQPGIANGIF